METYGHYEFESLLREEENHNCFDCGKTLPILFHIFLKKYQ